MHSITERLPVLIQAVCFALVAREREPFLNLLTRNRNSHLPKNKTVLTHRTSERPNIISCNLNQCVRTNLFSLRPLGSQCHHHCHDSHGFQVRSGSMILLQVSSSCTSMRSGVSYISVYTQYNDIGVYTIMGFSSRARCQDSGPDGTVTRRPGDRQSSSPAARVCCQ